MNTSSSHIKNRPQRLQKINSQFIENFVKMNIFNKKTVVRLVNFNSCKDREKMVVFCCKWMIFLTLE